MDPLVSALIFFLVRDVLAVIAFFVIFGLGVLIAAITDKEGWAFGFAFLAWVVAAAIAVWGIVDLAVQIFIKVGWLPA